MNGLDAQAPTRRVENAREERPGPFAKLRRRDLAQRAQVGEQLGLGHPHPGGEAAIDPLRHLGSARLGEGEAQDRLGRDTREQQAEHAGGQHLRLAGARRGGQPDMGLGIAGGGLRTLQRGQVRHGAGAHANGS